MGKIMSVNYHSVRLALLCILTSTLIVGLCPAVSMGRSGPGSVREKLLMDVGWKFSLGDASSPEGDFGYGNGASFAKAGEGGGALSPSYNDSAWRTINLPHDWAVELDFVKNDDEDVMSHGYKPVGRQFPKTTIGWYRKSFTIPREDENRRLAVKFDGVFRDCTVWLNGHYLGRNLSGYSEFIEDITDYATYGGRNVLVVRVDASNYEGWFYEGAGIYRHVWLLKYGQVHVPGYGVAVGTQVRKNGAIVSVQTRIENSAEARSVCELQTTIVDPAGAAVAQLTRGSISIPPHDGTTIGQDLTVPRPRLWSLEEPALYRLVTTIRSGRSLLDSCVTLFGIRTVRFDADKGFFLNDKPVKIKGVCCHQDHAGVGSALPDRLQYYRIEKLKEMGCNAYRTSHNPPTNEVLDACDSLGMLVMDENRLLGSTPEILDQFRTLILRDRNHPSVIIWSLGNEEWQVQDKSIGRRLASSLKTIQRQLDPTRLCTYAANNGNHYEGTNRVVDVRGINYIVLGDPDKYHRDHPAQPVIGSEEASTLCTRGIYANDSAAGFMSEFDLNAPRWGSTAERWWKFYDARPWLGGAFAWTGFDYRGEPTPYRWPCINSHFGIMDVCGFPKNNYYYYQAWWSDKDVLHIAPHWNWKGREGQAIDVWCESNCDSVELILNGRSLGTKVMPNDSHLQWSVPYEPGVLEARGVRAGRAITTKVETTGIPTALRLTADRSEFRADGEDVSVVTVTVVDEKGREVPDAGNLVKFSVVGEGRIIGVGNGNPSSHEPDKYLDGKYQRQLFNGKCQVIVQSTRLAGDVRLTAESPGISSTVLTLHGQECIPRPSVED